MHPKAKKQNQNLKKNKKKTFPFSIASLICHIKMLIVLLYECKCSFQEMEMNVKWCGPAVTYFIRVWVWFALSLLADGASCMY